LGDSRKYPYATTGGMDILTPLALGNSKMFYPPYPLNSKIDNPSSPPEFPIFFSDPLEFLFDCLKLALNGKLALFSPLKKILLTIFGQANKQLKFVTI